MGEISRAQDPPQQNIHMYTHVFTTLPCVHFLVYSFTLQKHTMSDSQVSGLSNWRDGDIHPSTEKEGAVLWGDRNSLALAMPGLE